MYGVNDLLDKQV